MAASISYIKGDLFQVTKSASKRPILAHSCNCYGSWGGGIAAQFRIRYPVAYQKYNEYCRTQSPNDIIGKTFIIKDNDVDIVCLFTSLGGGDSATKIVDYTRAAMTDMVRQYGDVKNLEINLPKINSGIFGVPWEMTENCLKEFDLTFNVYVV